MLELPALTGVTAAVYWQRFYARSSLLSHAPGLVAAAALFLAAKGDEHGRRVRDVINVIYRCEHTSPHGPPSSSNAQGSYQATTPQRIIPAYASPMHPASASMPPPGSSAPSTPAGTAVAAPSVAPPQPAPPVDDGCSLQVSPLFWELKEEVVRLEQHLLRVLGFGVRVTHPQPYVLHLGRTMEVSAELVRLAYYIANDSARTSLCLQYPPHTVACGCIFVAAELAQEQVRFHPQVLLSAAEQRGNTTTNTSGNSNINVKAPSPYRSPHHPGAGGGGGGTGGGSSSSSSTASYALTPSTHAAEWWEYFGVSQMQLEDCAHQLLELYDEQEEQAHQSSGGGSWAECNDYEQMMRYASPLAQLQRIGTEVAAELRREAAQDAARQQRIEDSLKERNNNNTGAGATGAVISSAAASAMGTPTRNVAASSSMRD
jgi:hypothetical protein